MGSIQVVSSGIKLKNQLLYTQKETTITLTITTSINNMAVFPSATPNDPSQNAQSEPITVASGTTTYGKLNQLPSGNMPYSIGINAAQGIRNTMEDTHAFVVDFDD
ncbi:hypothetical protein MPER_08340, partial [Moniliophthora perniciosa FA553]